MAFSFDIKGLDALKKSLAARPGRTKYELKRVLTEHVTAINKEQVQRASKMTDRGALVQGIGWVPVPGDEINFLLFSQAPYSAYIEFGTRKKFKAIPGVDASQYKGSGGSAGGKGFYDNILEWVKRKGIAGEYSTGYLRYKKGSRKRGKRMGTKTQQAMEDEQAAYAIYVYILRHGTKPQPFFFEPFLSRRGQITDDILKAINNIK